MNFKCVISGAVFLLCGCAGPAIISWQKAWDHETPLEQAAAKCDYETSAATQGVSPGFQTVLGVELDRQTRKTGLYEKCMNANGWVAAKDYTKARPF